MASFPADSPLVRRIVPSPNCGERRAGARIDILLLHYTGMLSGRAALDRLCDREAKVSSHYFVFDSGEVVQMVPEALRAQHAGESLWQGQDDVNSRSIGIEIENPGHDYGYPDFPDRQIEAVIALCRDIVARRNIPAQNVLAHSDVAPTRKQDPGEKFPWQRLYEHGVGLWVPPAPISTDGAASLQLGDRGAAVSELQRQLAAYGYGLPETGIYDALTKAVVTAFQLHFRPARVDGIADASTRETLRALLAARAGR
ncbi:MAG TPA: N-acetylmuramoyl-L-alanine amidase [Xanthobacteraceae bacterium]|nr:N-acetylmuramoyl-L-alanine amidase [Xanthobacteraceae bacterium]